MFAGHFGVAAAVKSKTTELPLWSLLVGTQLLDLVYIPFELAGLESIEPIGDGGYANIMVYAFYTHSFIGALLISIIAAFLAKIFWGKKSGFIMGSVVFSHWILDLIVHRPDLPILPGNAGNFPLMGLGLWESVTATFLLEFLLLAVGAILYFRYTLKAAGPERRGKAIAAGCVMTVFLFASLGFDAFA
ncbi:permease [Bacillus mesophilum]|uniref:Permease n=1 Tax=Bacillus mesophilum TaxID=1071718 RepID=A0A7V7RIY1_9BACI|nr:permease [Bacillus mesophilum]KAB2330342.1 permease [Bacillus mesophilum]